LQDSASPQIESAPGLVPIPDSTPCLWLRIAEWVLLAFLAIHFGVRSVPKAWNTLNTDFPDYYVTARLLHEHYDTSRVYEWTWLQRQKDHRDIDQRIINLMPSTAFSTLAVYPLTGMSGGGQALLAHLQLWLADRHCFPSACCDTSLVAKDRAPDCAEYSFAS